MSTTEKAEPLLLRCTENDGGRSARMLSRLAQRGELVRLAPGTYAATRRWLLLPQHERERVALVAFSASRRRPVTFCGASALELHGLPVVAPTSLLHVRAAHRGHSGTRRQPSPYVNGQAALRTLAELATKGWARTDGTVPMLPAVRHHWNPPGTAVSAAGEVMSTSGAAGVATGPSSCAATEVSVRLDDGTFLGRVHVDPLPAAMATVFGHEPLTIGTAPADALKRQVTGADALAEQARGLLRAEAQRTRFDAQWDFADRRSESPGESLSRALIHEYGFVVPDLQYEVRDSAGSVLARVDFLWEHIRLAAEFDGLTKYTGRLARPGAAGPVGQDALVREKRREDALRRLGYGVARWTWPDLVNRQRFIALLDQHGVPRRRG